MSRFIVARKSDVPPDALAVECTSPDTAEGIAEFANALKRWPACIAKPRRAADCADAWWLVVEGV